MAFQADGSWSKWLHVGWEISAASRLRSSRMAAIADRSARSTAQQSLLGVHRRNARRCGRDNGSARQRWDNATALFKLYPCAHVIQGYIDLALAMRACSCRRRSSASRVLWRRGPCRSCVNRLLKKRVPNDDASDSELAVHVASALIDAASIWKRSAMPTGSVPTSSPRRESRITSRRGLKGFDARSKSSRPTGGARAKRRRGGGRRCRLRAKFTALASPAFEWRAPKLSFWPWGPGRSADADGISGCLRSAPAP